MKYLTCAETAKLIRKDLKANFPGVKFSVRSRRGSAINIEYTNGPAEADVKAIARKYEAAGFDGMIDYQYYISHWYNEATGEVCIATNQGSEVTGGCYEGEQNDCPGEDWECVSFGANYIFVKHNVTADHFKEAVEMVAEKTGHDDLPGLNVVKVESSEAGWINYSDFACNGRDWDEAQWINNLIYETARELSLAEYMVKEAA